jgi:hypothetical protein
MAMADVVVQFIMLSAAVLTLLFLTAFGQEKVPPPVPPRWSSHRPRRCCALCFAFVTARGEVWKAASKAEPRR